MKTLGVLFLLSVVAAIAAVSPRALWEFRSMIKCTIPDSYPLLEFNDYGCFCGYGGSGTPVDQLDRCCQAHDQCYTKAKSVCAASNDTPYTKTYKYSCENKAITCSSSNNECEMLVCNCDRTAAMCFAKAPYNPAHLHLDKEKYCSS